MGKRSSQNRSKQPLVGPLALRALLIFTFLSVLFISTAFFTVYAGIKSGEIEKRFLKPAKESWQSFLKNLTAPAPSPSHLKLSITPTPTPTPTPRIQQSPPQIYYEYKQPQYSYPTPVPGRPGSKEWEEDFWRTWDERGKWIEQKNKEVEESQKKFCEQNPNLCNR